MTSLRQNDHEENLSTASVRQHCTQRQDETKKGVQSMNIKHLRMNNVIKMIDKPRNGGYLRPVS
jgi:hypothetical protein